MVLRSAPLYFLTNFLRFAPHASFAKHGAHGTEEEIKAFVTGATGLLGNNLVRALTGKVRRNQPLPKNSNGQPIQERSGRALSAWFLHKSKARGNLGASLPHGSLARYSG